MASTHPALILPSKGSPLELTQRPTPTPGPSEILIEVKSIALNPIDHYQRDYCLPPIVHFPAVLGSDIAGTVVSAGSSVSSDAPQAGTRVAAFAPCFFVQGAADYGAFQKFVLVPAVNVVPLPQGLSFAEASLLPMAVETAWAGFYSIGLPRDTSYTPADKQGLLVWGGASSVGSTVVQCGRIMGFNVYVAASTKHIEYLKSLGATHVFDYKDDNVIANLVKAAKDDGVTLSTGYDAVGQLKFSMDVLKQAKAEDTVAKLASAVPLPADAPKVEGVEVKFVEAPHGEKERDEHFQFVFTQWLKEKLAKGEILPSPKIKVIEGGLEGINKGLDELKGGVSGVKLVVEI